MIISVPRVFTQRCMFAGFVCRLCAGHRCARRAASPPSGQICRVHAMPLPLVLEVGCPKWPVGGKAATGAKKTTTKCKGAMSCLHQDRHNGEKDGVLATSSPDLLQDPPAKLPQRTELLLPPRQARCPLPRAAPGLMVLIGAFWGWGGGPQLERQLSSRLRGGCPRLLTLPSCERLPFNSPIEVVLSFRVISPLPSH